MKKLLVLVMVTMMMVTSMPVMVLGNDVCTKEEFLSHFDLELVKEILGTDFTVSEEECTIRRPRRVRSRVIIPDGEISLPGRNVLRPQTTRPCYYLRTRTRRGDAVLTMHGSGLWLMIDVGSGRGGVNGRTFDWYRLTPLFQYEEEKLAAIIERIGRYEDVIRRELGVDFEVIPQLHNSGYGRHRVHLNLSRPINFENLNHRWAGNGTEFGTQEGEVVIVDLGDGRFRLDIDYGRFPGGRSIGHRAYIRIPLNEQTRRQLNW